MAAFRSIGKRLVFQNLPVLRELRTNRVRISTTTSLRSEDNEAIAAYGVGYAEYGNPARVLTRVKQMISTKNAPGEVTIRMLAAPINPADINIIQGSYPIKPTLPAICGGEGVGEVISVGDEVEHLKVGDWVIPGHAGWGTWRTHATCAESAVRLIDNDIPVVRAATLAVNPCTAYRMLRDFEKLEPGDTVIQNGANSAVGQAVIQIAESMGIKTVNVVRNRPNMRTVVTLLQDLGASHVISEDEIRRPEMNEMWKVLQRPKLALNCTGGKSATELVRNLEKGGTMVTYGGMSKQPVTIPTGAFIFKDIRLRGFWMTEWNRIHKSSTESKNMLNHLCDLIRKGLLQQPMCELTHISDYKKAVKKSMEPFTNMKQVLYMDEHLKK